MTGIYLLYKNNEVIYVGQSVNMDRRTREHGRSNYDFAQQLPCDKHDLNRFEKELIETLKPKYNCKHNPDYYEELRNSRKQRGKQKRIEVDEETREAFAKDKPSGMSWKLYMRENAQKLKLLKKKK